MRMLFVLAAATGLRVGELFGLEVGHFDGSRLKIEQFVLAKRCSSVKDSERLSRR